MIAAAGSCFLRLFVLGVLALGAALPAGELPAPSASLAITPQQIEADWLLQDAVRNPPAADPNTPQRTTVTTAEDAAGAVGGIKDGTYGFHISGDASPW